MSVIFLSFKMPLVLALPLNTLLSHLEASLTHCIQKPIYKSPLNVKKRLDSFGRRRRLFVKDLLSSLTT